MKRLFTANVPADESTLQMLKSMLKEEGIACMVRNEQLSIAKGDIPLTECFPELWIPDDLDFPKAKKTMDDWKESANESHAPWECPHCKETIEGQFTSCWKCGTEKGEQE
jgi:hypothetical protein